MAQHKTAQTKRIPKIEPDEAQDEPTEATCVTCGIEFVAEPDQSVCDRCLAEDSRDASDDAADHRHEQARERRP